MGIGKSILIMTDERKGTVMGDRTWLHPEEYAYPEGTLRASHRRGRAVYPDGKVRAVRAGVPDTFFTIPAYGRIAGRYVAGYITVADWRDQETSNPVGVREGEYIFNVRRHDQP